jgi:hypothetical protein
VELESIQLLVTIHKDQVALVNTLWAIYQAISLAILGYVFSQEFVRKSPVILACLSVGFLTFAWANQRSMLRSQELIYAAAMQLKNIPANAAGVSENVKVVLNAYDAVSVSTLQFIYSTFSLLVVIGIWVPFLISRFFRASRETKQDAE